jgi:anti-anti-sigma regulatory factor
MNLQILNNQGIFEIHGDFIQAHAYIARTYFNDLLDNYYEIVICLKNVDKIDNSGLDVMRYIVNKGRKRSKMVFVLGDKNIINVFKKANLSNIFKNDYTC